MSCGVDGRDGTFTIIGGKDGRTIKDNDNRVTVYHYPNGTSRKLPNLNQGRQYAHSCTHVYIGGTLVGNFSQNFITLEHFNLPSRR